MFQYFLATGLFNAYPLPQRMAGVRRALKYTGELIDEGYCPLVFPEGARTTDGTMQPFKTGIGLMATRLRVPVVPIHIAGLFEIYPPTPVAEARDRFTCTSEPLCISTKSMTKLPPREPLKMPFAGLAARHFTS